MSKSVWDDIYAGNKYKAKYMEAKSLMMMNIEEFIRKKGCSDQAAADRLKVDASVINNILQGHIDKVLFLDLTRIEREMRVCPTKTK